MLRIKKTDKFLDCYGLAVLQINRIEFSETIGWITEWLRLKRTTMIINPPAMCRITNHQTRLPRATSNLALNAYRDGAFTISLGNLFQCFTTLCVKNIFLISNLKLPWLSLKPFLLVLSLSTLVNSHSPSCLYTPFKYWKAAMRSPQSLLFSKLKLNSCLLISVCVHFLKCWDQNHG